MKSIQEIKQDVGQQAEYIIARELGLEKSGTKYRCPNGGAHKHGDRTPSLSWDSTALQFHCFACGYSVDIYGLYTGKGLDHAAIEKELFGTSVTENRPSGTTRETLDKRAVFDSEIKKLSDIMPEQITYLRSRGIEEETIQHFGLMNYNGSIAFPYYDERGSLTGVKTRKPEKYSKDSGPKYQSITGSQLGLFHSREAQTDKPLVICEGEIDCMVVFQSGFINAVSVGTGANATGQIIDRYGDFLKGFDDLIIFSDNDQAGAKMDADFMSAFPDTVRLIDKRIMGGSKDANEVYFRGGSEAINKLIESARQKIEGFFVPDTDDSSIQDFFREGNFIPTGITSVDHSLNDLAPGLVTLVTGRSNGGKSTFINQVIANAIEKNRKAFIISGEEPQEIITNKLYRAVIGNDRSLYETVQINKRIFKEPIPAVRKLLKQWHKDKLQIFCKGESGLKTTEQLFTLISRKMKTEHYDLIVIDNLMSVLSIEKVAEKWERQADFIQRCCDLAKLHHCHIIVVLHPNKEVRQNLHMTFEQVSGSLDIVNKADNIIEVMRHYPGEGDPPGSPDAYITILKNRYFSDGVNRHIPLHYDIETGLLLEINSRGNAERYTFDLKRTKQEPEGFREILPWEVMD